MAIRKDRLDFIWEKQEEFMAMLRESGRLQKYPVDLKTKGGQRIIKETIFNLFEELAEASFTLKNKMHRKSDDQNVDVAHYREELGDAFAFFVEICILSGIDSQELFDEYVRKNETVKRRFENGY